LQYLQVPRWIARLLMRTRHWAMLSRSGNRGPCTRPKLRPAHPLAGLVDRGAIGGMGCRGLA
jgi:hypothetical protein